MNEMNEIHSIFINISFLEPNLKKCTQYMGWLVLASFPTFDY